MLRPASTPPLAVRLTVALLSICLFLALTELVLRLVDPDLYAKDPAFPVNRDIDFPDVYQKDASLFWRFRPDQTISSRRFSDLDYRINRRGMRGPETTETKNGYRILALGNSCTFGWGVDQEHIWVTQLERLLHNRLPGRSVELINAGVPGYTTWQGKRYFHDELVSLQPDLVLITFAWNDEAPAGGGITDDHRPSPGRLVLGVQNLFSRLRFYQFMRKLILLARGAEPAVVLDDPAAVRRVPADAFRRNLTEIIREARANQCQPVLVIPPIASLHLYFKGAVSALHTTHAAYQEQIRLVSQYERVPLVDLQTAFDRHTALWDDPYADCTHYNAAGHAVAAETIAQALLPLLH